MADTLLPHNATPFERSVEQLAGPALMPPVPLRDLWSPETCPAELLSWLAHAFSVDTWDEGWSEGAKRAVIRQSLQVHRHKGTIQSVQAALASAGFGDAQVIERFGWEFYDGTATHDGATTYAPPDHWAEYRIRLQRPITVEQAAQVRAILRDVAPARCHLKAFDFTEAQNTYNARITHDGQFTHGTG